MILIVDDEPSALVMLEMVLQKDNHAVCRAKSGREALRMLSNGGDENCSLVITDIRMPVMDGRELIAQMRANPRLSRIPVIMCTSSTDRDTVVEMIGQGARDYIVKPFKAAMVLAKVRSVLANVVPVVEPRSATIERLAIDAHRYPPLAGAMASTLEVIGDHLAEALGARDAGAVGAVAEQVGGPASVFGANRVVTAAHCVLMASDDAEALRLGAILEVEIGELRTALERVAHHAGHA